jgi:hypothetical protein
MLAPLRLLGALGQLVEGLAALGAVVVGTDALHRLHQLPGLVVVHDLGGDLREAVLPDRQHGLDPGSRNFIGLRGEKAGVGDQTDCGARVVHDRHRAVHRGEALDRQLALGPLMAVGVRPVGLDVLALQPEQVVVGRLLFEVLGEGEVLDVRLARREGRDRRDQIDAVAVLEEMRSGRHAT